MTVVVYILLCLIWGSTWYAIKIGLADAPPLFLLSFRFLVAIALLFCIVAVRRFRLPTNPKQLLRTAYPGMFMFGMSYTFVYFAETFISSALTSVLFALFPFFVALFTYWILPDERLSRRGWYGLIFGFIGVVVISYDSLTLSGELFLGTMLAMGAPFVSAYGITIHKRRYGRDQVIPTVAVQMAAGGLPLTVIAFLVEDLSDFHVTLGSVGSVIYLGIFGSVVTFGSYYWLIKRIRVVHASLIAFITPIVAIFIGVIIFDEPFRPAAIIGTISILSGILLVTRR